MTRPRMQTQGTTLWRSMYESREGLRRAFARPQTGDCQQKAVKHIRALAKKLLDSISCEVLGGLK